MQFITLLYAVIVTDKIILDLIKIIITLNLHIRYLSGLLIQIVAHCTATLVVLYERTSPLHDLICGDYINAHDKCIGFFDN